MPGKDGNRVGRRGLPLFLRALWDPQARVAAAQRLQRPPDMFQADTTTGANRYPRVFQFARTNLADSPDLRLLSFGCAAGQEVFTLGRYFAKASIKGIDINPIAIAAARRAAPVGDAERMSFEVAGSAAAELDASYDAIFALAVFRHGDLKARPPRCDHLIRFATFERIVLDLARCLRPGGYLFIRYAHFRFADTAAMAGFETALWLEPPPPVEPLYGPDNRLLVAPPDNEAGFRKKLDRSGKQTLSGDLADVAAKPSTIPF